MIKEPGIPAYNEYLPSLEGLSDTEYLERSREFGQQWTKFIAGEEPHPDGPKIISAVNATLQARSAEFARLPEADRALFLIEEGRHYDAAIYQAHSQEPPKTYPLTPELLEKAEVRVIETRPGVPAIVHNDRYTHEIFGYDSTNFAKAGMAETDNYLPFVVLHDTETHSPYWFKLNKTHETSHILWRMAYAQQLTPESTYEGSEKSVLNMVIEEGICLSTAGQNTFLHASNVEAMKRWGMDDMLETYRGLNELHAAAIHNVDSQDLTLGIMLAKNLDDLRTHFERMQAIAKSVPLTGQD